MSDYKQQTDQSGSPGDASKAQRGIARVDQLLHSESPVAGDQQLSSEQSSFSGDTRKAQHGLERIDHQLGQDGQSQVADSQEQLLPYGEIFRQNYDHLSGDFRAALRNQEQGSFQEVAVKDLPETTDVRGAQDFNHHITYADAKLHTEQLNEVVLPWVRAGAVSDDFRALDQRLGRTNPDGLNNNGYYETYQLFYGNQPIIVGKSGEGTFDVVGGRHRIYMAKELGLQSIPVHISSAKPS